MIEEDHDKDFGKAVLLAVPYNGFVYSRSLLQCHLMLKLLSYFLKLLTGVPADLESKFYPIKACNSGHDTFIEKC